MILGRNKPPADLTFETKEILKRLLKAHLTCERNHIDTRESLSR